MKTRLSILLLASLLLSGCGATAVPTATLVQSTPTLLVPEEPTSTASIVTPTLDIATIIVTEQSATPELTTTPESTATIPQVQMQVLPDGQQTALPPSGVCQQPQNWVAYTVQRSDTLSSLGQRTGTGWQQIQSANCLTSTIIFSGQMLYLPFIPPTLAVTNLPNPEPSPVPAGPTNPLVSVSPTSGKPGTTFTITIDDFPRNQSITLEIVLIDVPVSIIKVLLTPDQNGDATFGYISPQDAKPGTYKVFAVSSDGLVTKDGEFKIDPP